MCVAAAQREERTRAVRGDMSAEVGPGAHEGSDEGLLNSTMPSTSSLSSTDACPFIGIRAAGCGVFAIWEDVSHGGGSGCEDPLDAAGASVSTGRTSFSGRTQAR